MIKISALNLEFKELNEKIKAADGDVLVSDCYGQRFIGCGLKDKTITIEGTPGNALGAYLDGTVIKVNGNVQDAVGDTMNEGRIIVYGDAGDALGYAMRGGVIYVRGNAGYRTGIHMKQYKDKKPVIVVGGKVGSFLGEYLAGGAIIVLGIGIESLPVGNFTGTGMHGGCIFIRSSKDLGYLPEQVVAKTAEKEDMEEILPYLEEFCRIFNLPFDQIAGDTFYVLRPNAKNPYKQMYTVN